MNPHLTRIQLERHEGRREKPYDDATGETVKPGDCIEGNITIGVGWNLSARGLPDGVIERLENRVIQGAHNRLKTEEYYEDLNDARQAALISMVVNLGWGGFQSFEQMRIALRGRNYRGAAEEMIDSRWADQTGRRAEELAEQILTGSWHETVDTDA